MCVYPQLFLQVLRLRLLSGKWSHLAKYQRHLQLNGLVIAVSVLPRGADQASEVSSKVRVYNSKDFSAPVERNIV